MSIPEHAKLGQRLESRAGGASRSLSGHEILASEECLNASLIRAIDESIEAHEASTDACCGEVPNQVGRVNHARPELWDA